ncbi:MAG: hypothetical protein AAGJ28_13820 [Pseudomonadota bacterium]
MMLLLMLTEEARTRRDLAPVEERPDRSKWRWLAVGTIVGALLVYFFLVD